MSDVDLAWSRLNGAEADVIVGDVLRLSRLGCIDNVQHCNEKEHKLRSIEGDYENVSSGFDTKESCKLLIRSWKMDKSEER